MLWEILRIALQSITGHKFRSFLTVLSVTIGAFSIVVMTSLAQGGSNTLLKSVEQIGGARLVWWVPQPPEDRQVRSRYPKGLSRDDLEALQGLPFTRLVSGMTNYNQQTIYVTADKTIKIDTIGMLPRFLDGLTWKVATGRTFTAEEESSYARVVLLSDGVANRLFPAGGAVGKTVNLMGKPYQVVGVLAKRKMLGVSLGFEWDKVAIIPTSTGEKREGMPSQAIVLVAFTEKPELNPTVVSLGNARLLARHNGVADFRSINFGDILGQFFEFFKVLNLIVGLIAGISMLAGGIGVMNIMLVSVAERVREIGIRKALGASVLSIMIQFLGEATVLSGLGGMTGILGGLGTTLLANLAIAQWSDAWVGQFSVLGIVLALGSTSAIGVIFGAIPASQAARLDIVECLRR